MIYINGQYQSPVYDIILYRLSTNPRLTPDQQNDKIVHKQSDHNSEPDPNLFYHLYVFTTNPT